MHGANHNIFTEKPCPSADIPAQLNVEYQSSSKALTLLTAPQLCQTLEIRADRRRMSCVFTTHSCRSLWWCRQLAPPLTAKKMPGKKRRANSMTQMRWEKMQRYSSTFEICIRRRSMKEKGVEERKQWSSEETWQKTEVLLVPPHHHHKKHSTQLAFIRASLQWKRNRKRITHPLEDNLTDCLHLYFPNPTSADGQSSV